MDRSRVILVTGVAGFWGREVARALISRQVAWTEADSSDGKSAETATGGMHIIGVDKDPLTVRFVVEHELIEAFAAFGRIRLDKGLGVVLRQIVVRFLFVVVRAAEADGSVGITFNKVDEHFLPDARDRLEAISRYQSGQPPVQTL